MRPTELLLILAFGYLSLTSLRNVMWWGWVTAPIMAANFVACGERWRERRMTNDERRTTNDGQATEDAIRNPQSAIHNTERPVLNWGIAVIMLGSALLFTPLWRQV